MVMLSFWSDISVLSSRGLNRLICGGLGFCGTDALAALRHVALGGFFRFREVLGRVGVSKSRPCGKPFGLNGFEPCGLERKSSRRMKVSDKGANTW